MYENKSYPLSLGPNSSCGVPIVTNEVKVSSFPPRRHLLREYRPTMNCVSNFVLKSPFMDYGLSRVKSLWIEEEAGADYTHGTPSSPMFSCQTLVHTCMICRHNDTYTPRTASEVSTSEEDDEELSACATTCTPSTETLEAQQYWADEHGVLAVGDIDHEQNVRNVRTPLSQTQSAKSASNQCEYYNSYDEFVELFDNDSEDESLIVMDEDEDDVRPNEADSLALSMSSCNESSPHLPDRNFHTQSKHYEDNEVEMLESVVELPNTSVLRSSPSSAHYTTGSQLSITPIASNTAPNSSKPMSPVDVVHSKTRDTLDAEILLSVMVN
eukprot:CFRG1487T1